MLTAYDNDRKTIDDPYINLLSFYLE